MSESLDDVLQACVPLTSAPHSFSIEPVGAKKPINLHLWLVGELVEKVHLVIATHGAGGTSQSDACAHLCSGIASATPQTPLAVLAFDGTMNLKSRTTAFLQVIEYASLAERISTITLAGRSMGCRAAALAYTQSESEKLSGKLILQSYPLVGKGEEARLQPLLDLPEDAKVLFVQGSNDDMCPRDRLLAIMEKEMKAKSSTFFVSRADHGMGLTGLHARGRVANKATVTKETGIRAAELCGEWLFLPEQPTLDYLPGWIDWHKEGVKWTGWWQPWPDHGRTSVEASVSEDMQQLPGDPESTVDAEGPSRKRARHSKED